MTTWESVLSAMTKPLGDDIIEILFLEQLRHPSALRDEIAIYDRSKRGTPARSYTFLVESVKRYFERARRSRNRKAMERALGGAAPAAPAPATPAAKEKGKGKGRKGKASRSLSNGRGGGKKGGKGKNPPRPPSPGAICYDWQKTGKCSRPGCKYAHPPCGGRGPGGGRNQSRGKGKGKGRNKSKDSRSSSTRSAKPCHFYKQGK